MNPEEIEIDTKNKVVTVTTSFQAMRIAGMEVAAPHHLLHSLISIHNLSRELAMAGHRERSRDVLEAATALVMASTSAEGEITGAFQAVEEDIGDPGEDLLPPQSPDLEQYETPQREKSVVAQGGAEEVVPFLDYYDSLKEAIISFIQESGVGDLINDGHDRPIWFMEDENCSPGLRIAVWADMGPPGDHDWRGVVIGAPRDPADYSPRVQEEVVSTLNGIGELLLERGMTPPEPGSEVWGAPGCGHPEPPDRPVNTAQLASILSFMIRDLPDQPAIQWMTTSASWRHEDGAYGFDAQICFNGEEFLEETPDGSVGIWPVSRASIKALRNNPDFPQGMNKEETERFSRTAKMFSRAATVIEQVADRFESCGCIPPVGDSSIWWHPLLIPDFQPEDVQEQPAEEQS